MINKIILLLKKSYKLIKSIKYSPFSLQSRFKPNRLYSDFFVLNTAFAKTFFIAENIYYLYEKKSLKVNHEFKFYDEEGILFQEFNHSSGEIISKILLPLIQNKSKYISFTHNSYHRNKQHYLDKNLSIQHRGYTIFFKNKDSLGAILHGNTGSISPNKIKQSSMIQRNKLFIYTPIYKFLEKDTYDLVFNNPTNKKLEINIVFDYLKNEQEKTKKYLIIKPYGTKFITISNHKGSISFISKLGICRCAIFKNPNIYDQNFDVFHS